MPKMPPAVSVPAVPSGLNRVFFALGALPAFCFLSRGGSWRTSPGGVSFPAAGIQFSMRIIISTGEAPWVVTVLARMAHYVLQSKT
jgi:hypothetical protein